MLPELPWWAWLFGVLFWTLVAIRRHRGPAAPSGGAESGSEDRPMWSPFRRGGGF